MDEGAIIVDNTTASAAVARELYAAAKAKDIAFVKWVAMRDYNCVFCFVVWDEPCF